jgi:hypothetical protein
MRGLLEADVPDRRTIYGPFVKKALNKVSGVSKIEVSYEKKTSHVAFDDAKILVI